MEISTEQLTLGVVTVYSNSSLFITDNTSAEIDRNFSAEEPLKWDEYAVIVCLFVYALIGATGNFLICVVQFSLQEKSSTDYLIAGLAIIDIIDSTTNTTVQILLYWYGLSILSSSICRIRSFAAQFTGLSAAAFIGVLSVDRYFLTCKPFSRVYSVKTAKCLCVIIPLAVGVLASPFAIFKTNVYGGNSCSYSNEYFMRALRVSIVGIIVFIFVVIITCYTKIAIMLRKRIKTRFRYSEAESKQTETQFPNCSQSPEKTSSTNTDYNGKHAKINRVVKDQRAEQATRKEKAMNRTTILLFVISVVFAISFSSGILYVLLENTLIRAFKNFLIILRRSSAVSNPILLVSMSSKFRNRARTLVFRNRI